MHMCNITVLFRYLYLYPYLYIYIYEDEDLGVPNTGREGADACL